MNITTLTDRYIDAAMRTVPEAQRADLAAELRASIADQIEGRIDAGEDRDAAERAVLTELGDPDVLAAGYTDRPLWLIGPRYFLDWWRLLKLLLWIVVPCAAFGVALGKTLSGATIGDVAASTAIVIIQVIVNLGFWTVVVFATLERTMPKDAGGFTSARWTPDQLPEPRQSGARFGDMLGSLITLAILVGVILWDGFIGFDPRHPGLSFLDPRLWPWWIAGLFAVMALEAVLAIAVYLRGRWTVMLATANAVLNLAVGVTAVVLLSAGRLINPAFFPAVIPADSAETVANVVSIVTGFLFAGIAVWSTIDGFVKARPGISARS